MTQLFFALEPDSFTRAHIFYCRLGGGSCPFRPSKMVLGPPSDAHDSKLPFPTPGVQT